MIKTKFQSVFSKSDPREIKAPKALKKYLNEDVPEGYSYELLEGSKDIYVLRPKSNKEKNSFQIRIKFPLIFEGIEIKSIEELLEAMYRTQKWFKLDEELQNDPPTIIHIGGDKILNQFIASTEEFPELPSLKIKVGGNEVEVPIKRIPYPSLDELKIVSDKNSLFKVEMLINESSSVMELTVNLNYDIIETVDQYFDNFGYISSFNKEGVTIFGKVFLPEKHQTNVFEKNHEFLNALRKLQEYFGIKFNFPHELEKDDIYYTQILFESFVNNRMVSIGNNDQVSFLFEKENFDFSKPYLDKDKELGVVLHNELSLELFGANIKIMEYKVYTRMNFEKIITENEEVRVVFKLPPNSRHYIRYYSDSISEDEAKEIDNLLFDLTETAIDIERINFS